MKRLKLSTVTRTQGANQALKDGSVAPSDVELDFIEVPVLVDGFRRMVRHLEFDVCEMAISTYLCAKDHGVGFTALPIFIVRDIPHGTMYVNPASGISDPKELEGRRVGVNRGYTVTTGVWARSILQDEYDVDLANVTWVRSGDEHVASYVPPANVDEIGADRTLEGMLAEGELAAVVGATMDVPRFAHLIPNPEEAGYETVRRRGLFPINHLVVVRDELLEAHRELAADLFTTFAQAKTRYIERLRGTEISTPTPADVMNRRVMEITGSDPLPYGIEPNRQTIESLIDHLMTQRILMRRPTIDELFADGTQELIA